jgi:peptidoglycan/LPS O-acetylase OafA/YrhL
MAPATTALAPSPIPHAALPTRANGHSLNTIRGLSALAVLVYHIRYRFFLDYADISLPDFFSTLFYTLTSFGHDAVMVFFVLSGYLITTSVQEDLAMGRWSWTRYAVKRLSRLYVVLIPALLLTVVWDGLGLYFYSNHPIYTGEARSWSHDFFSVQERLTLQTFAINLLFLQTICGPPLGSNEPLWSLSYEFWYYCIFPLAWLAFVNRNSFGRSAIYLILCVGLLISVGGRISLYFPIWLLGGGVALLTRTRVPRRELSSWWRPFFVTAFFSVVCATHLDAFRKQIGHAMIVCDYVVGIAFALLLYALQRCPNRGRSPSAGFWRSISGCSYTLYLTHMPLLVLIRAAVIPDRSWPPTLLTVGYACALALLCVVFAYLISLTCEARTSAVRMAIGNRLLAFRRSAAPQYE